jgi:hypothetical protein
VGILLFQVVIELLLVEVVRLLLGLLVVCQMRVLVELELHLL